MDIAPTTMTSAMTVATRQLQATSEMQMAVMKQIADGQEQMANMLQALGIGNAIDVQA